MNITNAWVAGVCLRLFDDFVIILHYATISTISCIP